MFCPVIAGEGASYCNGPHLASAVVDKLSLFQVPASA